MHSRGFFPTSTDDAYSAGHEHLPPFHSGVDGALKGPVWPLQPAFSTAWGQAHVHDAGYERQLVTVDYTALAGKKQHSEGKWEPLDVRGSWDVDLF